jgi:hypothetical protein
VSSPKRCRISYKPLATVDAESEISHTGKLTSCPQTGGADSPIKSMKQQRNEWNNRDVISKPPQDIE